ncbi:DUF2855 family protein [Flavobacteriaceae bacterium TP-CH-4]|uniref:DUF2855 family protein n=1 Tax=Pelagihabitans pacificus TaxID=2696054 RepID=A0A967ARY0_9FLAO|nr:DUF2855 family protein [Pelagihabitans pacificus]NHF58090.1 DUF2855 family protein [Pelagihabitans pacificus]
MNNSFQVNKTDFFECRLVASPLPELSEDEVLLRIGSFAFTSNNITYAVVGDKLGYWKFFPSAHPWGIIPVWGFAEVVASKYASIAVGDRYYGYWPMRAFLKVRPIRVTSHGFVDGTLHRKELPPIYNFYLKDGDRRNKESSGYYSIIKPLFTTAYLNYQFLKKELFFDASQIVLTGASSKTALGIAFMLHLHKKEHGKKVVALTSKRNADFVRTTTFYDKVVAYGDIAKELDKEASVIIDLTGNTKLLFQLTEQLGNRLQHISLIGLADWQSAGSKKAIPKSKFFFAPDHARKFYTEVGQEEANQRIEMAQKEFTAQMEKWLALQFVDFQKGMEFLYLQMLKGTVDPSKGYVVTLNLSE